jgi:hypothetical protein
LLEVDFPKIEFDFDYFNFKDNINRLEGRIRHLSESLSENLPALPNFPTLPSLPQVYLRVPEVSLPKLELYAYLLRTLQSLILIFNTISWFSLVSLNSVSLTTQINSTISNFYCFMSQIMEIINFSNKKSWEELKAAVTEIRKRFSTLSCAVPTNLNFRELADGRLRIYFLCAQSKFDTLLYVDIDNNTKTNPVTESDSQEQKL